MERKKSLSAKYLLMVFVFVMTLLAAVGTSAGSIHASAASINKKSVRLVKGRTEKLKISGTKKKVKWKTSRPAVVSVSSSGKITAKKKGSATITATVGKKKYTCKVKVYNTLTKKQAEKAVAAYCTKQGYTFWYSTEAKKNNRYNVWVSYSTGCSGKYVVNTKTGTVTCYEPYGFESMGIEPERTVRFSALKYL